MSNQDIEISELRSRLAASEASLARLVEGVEKATIWSLSPTMGVMVNDSPRQHARQRFIAEADLLDLLAILPAKADKLLEKMRPAPVAVSSVAEDGSVPVPTNENMAKMMVLLGTNWLKEFAPERLKADKPAVPTRPGITIDRKTFHDMMENYRAAVSEGTAQHTYRVTVEFVDLYAAQQREAGYHAGFMDASKPQPDNGG